MSGRKQGKAGRAVAFVLLTLALVLFAAGGCMAYLYNEKYQDLAEMTDMLNASGFYPGTYINGVDVSGRSYDEVLAELQSSQENAGTQTLTVNADGRTYALSTTATYNTEEVLAQAYNYGREGTMEERCNLVNALKENPIDYTVECDLQSEDPIPMVQQIVSDLTVAPVDATVGAFDPETESFTFTDEVSGVTVDDVQLLADIQNALNNGDYTANITVNTMEVPASVTRAQLESQNRLLATFSTTATKVSARNTNIKLALASFNGAVVQPGETFSINQATGKRTKEKGYKDAGAILNGIMVSEPGGGVCQVSTTLFNAVVRAGMEIVERYGHSWPSDYISIGMDAAIDYPAKDFKFKNVSDMPIYLVTAFNDKTHELTVKVYGKPVLEEGVTIDLRSTTDSTIPRPDPTYQTDTSLAPGYEETIRKSRKGYKSTTYIQYKKDDEVIEEKLLFTTVYPAISAIIVQGPPLPAETPTPTPDYSELDQPSVID